MAEHPKSKSTGGFYRADGSPCSWVTCILSFAEPRVAGEDPAVAVLQHRLLHHLHLLLPVDDPGRNLQVGRRIQVGLVVLLERCP